MVQGRRVAAPDSLKSETFFRDPKILKNHAVERLTAATQAVVNRLSTLATYDDRDAHTTHLNMAPKSTCSTAPYTT